MKIYKFIIALLVLFLLAGSSGFYLNPLLPLTGEAYREENAQPVALPALSSFITSMKNGQPSLLAGVYVPGVMAYPVLQQPGADAGYVSTQANTVTQFRMAGQFNSIGLLAHD